MVRMRPNVGALRFPTLMMTFDIIFPGKFSMYNTRQLHANSEAHTSVPFHLMLPSSSSSKWTSKSRDKQNHKVIT